MRGAWLLATLALAWAAARACEALGTPLPWMIGPLLATSAAALAGAPVRSAPVLRNVGQWTIGTALGLYFTPRWWPCCRVWRCPSPWRWPGPC
jgi:uncharacterized membrane protein AbrB (regulator of aidB expression)